MRMTKTGWRRLGLGALVALGLLAVAGVGYMAVLQVGLIKAQQASRQVATVLPPPSVVGPEKKDEKQDAQQPAAQPPASAPAPAAKPATKPPVTKQPKAAPPAKAVQPLTQLVKPATAAPSPMGPERAVGCEVGNKIPTYRADQFRIELLGARENARALQVLNGQIVGDAVLNLYQEVKAGNVPRLDRDGKITVTLDGVNAGVMPDRIWYATGNDICAGYVPVQRTARGFQVTVPIRAGEHRGQTSVILPRDVLSGTQSALVCVRADYDIYAPELIAGHYRGEKNKICGLPGSAGTTRISEMVRDGKKWVMFGLVKLN